MPATRPRILHVYKDYWPPIVGGVEKVVHWLAHGCADEYDVEVLVCSRERRARTDRDGPIVIHQVGEWGRIASAPLAPGFLRALRRIRADILHYHHPNPTGELAHLLARPPGRVVVTYHSDIVRQRLGLTVYAPFLRRFLRRADVILPTSPNYIESSPFLRPLRSRCRPIPLGIPLDGFEATPARLEAARAIRARHDAECLALFVGQFREYKGVPFLIEALARIRDEANVHALLVGGGPEKATIAERVRALGLEDRVTFCGRLSDEEMIDHFHACDVFVLPSHRRSEAFGIVQVEAMACGKPVLSTNLASGVPFVNRDGETGVVVEPGDAEALAAGLRRLATDAELRRRLGEGGRARARSEFAVATMVGRVKDVYATLLAERPRAD